MKVSDLALNLNEKRKLQKFMSMHKICHTRIMNVPDYSLGFSYESGVGTSTYVTCKFCGKRANITDYGTW